MSQDFFEKYIEWKNSSEYTRVLLREKKEIVKLKRFIKDFSLKKIKKMKIKDYVIGNESKKSFCYRLEVELKNLCELRGRTTAYQKYGVYWDKKKKSMCSVLKKQKRII